MTERNSSHPPANSSALLHARQIWEMLQSYWVWWVGPAIAGAVLAFGYLSIANPSWRATQALEVRDEAVGSDRSMGRFDSVDAMKVYIEKINEIARHEAVIGAALVEVGPPEGASADGEWPTTRDIQLARETISVQTPAASDFGRSEIVYLSADAASRERAIALTNALTNQLELRLRELRNSRSQSIISELEKKLQLGKQEMEGVTKQLQAFEAEVGADLVELRVLESGSGEGNLRNVLNKIKSDLGQAKARQATLELQRANLATMQAEPQQLVAAPGQLLESQPALKRLKDGLVDAQIRQAELLGRMSEEHPQVIAAKENVQQVRQNLFNELAITIRGLATDQQVNLGLIKQLEKQEADLNARLDLLAGKRARYANLVAEVKNRATILEQAQKDLSDAEASRNAAATTSLLTRIDTPTSGDRPLGPSKLTVLLGGILGGLIAGLGLVFLVSSPAVQQAGRRWSDFLYGRRSSDVPGGAPSGPPAPAAKGVTASPSSRAGVSQAAASPPAAPAPASPPAPVAPSAPAATSAPGGRRSEDRNHNPSATLQASLASLAGGARQGRRASDPIAPVAPASVADRAWTAGSEDRRGGGERRQSSGAAAGEESPPV